MKLVYEGQYIKIILSPYSGNDVATFRVGDVPSSMSFYSKTLNIPGYCHRT